MSFEDLNGEPCAQEPFEHLDAREEALAAEPKSRAPRKKSRAGLCVSEPLSEHMLSELAESSADYALWLRIVMLRVLIRTPALGRLKGRAGYHLTQTCEFLGFENFDDFAETHSLAEMRRVLRKVLAGWEQKRGPACRFPTALQNNLRALADVIGLDGLEMDVLGLAVLVHVESTLEGCCELLGTELAGFSVERVLAPMLGHKVEAVSKRLQRAGTLACSGLLTIDLSGRYGLRQLMDLLTATFASRMLTPQSDIRKIVEGFVRPMPASSLSAADYLHVKTNLEVCKAVLQKAAAERTGAVNILIYGRPGSGKTELARLLATELELPLMEISPSNLAGAPVAPIRRVRNYRIAQAFFKHNPSLILFDECEEILDQGSRVERSDDEANVPRKSWINKVLETNAVPTLWIANSIRRFDESCLRRFSVCFEMPLPGQEQRQKMLAKAFGGAISAGAQASIARNKEATPAILVQTASVLRSIAGDKCESERDALAVHLVNNTLRAQSKTAVSAHNDQGIAAGGFEPGWVNCGVDLRAVCGSLQHSRSGRLCLWGPPGTGKTAFGKWLAQELDMPHLVIKASELLSAYVGETEKNIARAFETARQQDSLLQFDEVDSFLQDRQRAAKQWEVTQVNEMLTQMEGFQGVFVASTNLFQHLDEASLRRFDMAIKFDYLAPEAAWAMFQRTCAVLQVEDAEHMRSALLKTPLPLTPGDFEQLVRRSRLLRPHGADQVWQDLKSAASLKKLPAGRQIGFL